MPRSGAPGHSCWRYFPASPCSTPALHLCWLSLQGLPPLALDGSIGSRGSTILHSSSLTNRFVVLMTSLPGRALVAVPPHRMPDGLPKRRSVVAECSREGGVIHDERLFELVEHLDRLAQHRIEES
jgi:hypothetical protein